MKSIIFATLVMTVLLVVPLVHAKNLFTPQEMAKFNSIPTKVVPPTGEFRGFNYNTKEVVILPSPTTYSFTTIQNKPCLGEETIGGSISSLDKPFDNIDKEGDINPQMGVSDALIHESPNWNSSMYFWCGIYSSGSSNTDENSEQQNNPNVLH